MRSIITLFLLVIYTSGAFAQIDSLLKSAETINKEAHTYSRDTSLVSIYNNLAEQLYKTARYDEALEFANKVLPITNGVSSNKDLYILKLSLAKAYNTIGRVYSVKSNYYKAIEYHNKALSISKLYDAEHHDDISTKRVMAIAYNGIGGNYYFLGVLDKSAEAFIKAIKLFEEIGDDKKIASSYNNIGLIYQQKQDFNSALSYYQKGLAISTKADDKRTMASSYNNIGNIYSINADNDSAKKSKSLRKERFDKALASFFKALEINTKTANKNWMAFNYANIGNIYERLNDYSLGLSYYLKALKIREELGEKRGIALSNVDVGNTFFKQERYAAAKKHFKISLKIASELNLRPQMLDAYLALSECANKEGDYKEAYRFRTTYSLLKDTIFNENSTRQIADMQVKYETEKKEKENALLLGTTQVQQAQITKQRFLFIGALIILMMLASIVYSQYKIKQRTEQANQEKLRFKAIIETEEKERVRIAKELHDGLGQLLSTAKLNVAGLGESIIEEDKQLFNNSLTLIDDAVQEVRNISHNMMPNALIQLGLIPALKEAVAKINDSHLFQINFTDEGFEERLNESVEIAFYRIVQEALNNIIKYSQAKQVDIIIKKINNAVQLYISDNGVGFDTNKIEQSKGIGWKNIFSRVSLLNGNIQIDSKPGSGTQLSINISV